MAPRCEICQSTFETIEALKRHLATWHLTSSVYMMVVLVHPERPGLRSKHLKCLFCQAKFPDYSSVETHLRSVHPEINFPPDPPCVSEMFCLQCVEKFPTHPQLMTHLRVIHGLTTCPCPCGMPIGESECTKIYKQQLKESAWNYIQPKAGWPDGKKLGAPPYMRRTPNVRDLLALKRAGVHNLEGQVEGEENEDKDEEDDVDDEEEAEEVADHGAFRQEFRYINRKVLVACGCCKKEYLSKEDLMQHMRMRTPSHTRTNTYTRSIYHFGKLSSCFSHSMKLFGNGFRPPPTIDVDYGEEESECGSDDYGIFKKVASLPEKEYVYRCPRCDQGFSATSDVSDHLKEKDCLQIPTDSAKLFCQPENSNDQKNVGGDLSTAMTAAVDDEATGREWRPQILLQQKLRPQRDSSNDNDVVILDDDDDDDLVRTKDVTYGAEVGDGAKEEEETLLEWQRPLRIQRDGVNKSYASRRAAIKDAARERSTTDGETSSTKKVKLSSGDSLVETNGIKIEPEIKLEVQDPAMSILPDIHVNKNLRIEIKSEATVDLLIDGY